MEGMDWPSVGAVAVFGLLLVASTAELLAPLRLPVAEQIPGGRRQRIVAWLRGWRQRPRPRAESIEWGQGGSLFLSCLSAAFLVAGGIGALTNGNSAVATTL